MDSSNKKVALVTGGASGIGLAISKALAAEGFAVVVNYNASADAANVLVSSIQKSGGRALALQANIAQATSVDNLIAKTIETFGQLDVLVNNAGVTDDALLLRMTEEQFDKVIAIDLKGVWLTARAALKHIIRSPRGRIINISSFSGLYGLAGQTNYAAAKAGVIGFTKSLAHEVAGRNVTVNAIAPGYIETSMTQNLDQTVKTLALNMIPLKRYGKPEDIAHAVVFLASDKAQYITGQTLSVDGGMYM